MIKFDSLAFLAEEYTYMYQDVRDPYGMTLNEAIDFISQNVPKIKVRIKNGNSYSRNFPNELFDVESGWYTNKELKNKANNVLLFWLKLFHEAEYKRSTLIKYGISTTTCDYIINGVWKMFTNVYDFAMNKWLIIHSMKNKYFHFGRDVFEPNELDSWYKIFNHAGMWFGSQDIDDETIRPEIYDWPGNSIENNEVATEIVNSYNNLVKAKTIKEKIISTTIALNTMHHTGELVTMSGLLDEDKLNYLSNLPKKPWDGELYKEFGIKIS